MHEGLALLYHRTAHRLYLLIAAFYWRWIELLQVWYLYVTGFIQGQHYTVEWVDSRHFFTVSPQSFFSSEFRLTPQNF